jgi:hypothetical protein
VAVEGKPVEERDGVVVGHRVLGVAAVGDAHALERPLEKNDARCGKRAQEVLDDVHRHAVEADRRVVGRQRLVLVLEAVGGVDLADAPRGALAEHLEEEPDLESPVAGDADPLEEIGLEGELAGERVTKGGEVGEVRMTADDVGQGLQQGSDEQPCDATVEAVGEARVVALGEVEAQHWVDDRVDEVGEERAVVVDDIGVVQGNCIGAGLGEDVADRHPHRTTLSRREHPDARRHIVLEREHVRSIVPQDDRSLAQGAEVAQRSPVPGLVGAVERDDDGVEVRDLGQLGHHAGECGLIHLGDQTGDDERHRRVQREAGDLPLALLEILPHEAGERGYRSALLKIAHASTSPI